ncbi:penicillin-binding protein 1C [Methyloceanibacter sp.]|uniref:penicillin-binding protein 1C n=1 Tax=Methyloceanibacter sp. TaxID=1965321 RepID=UPI002D614963|nr:penicillin-binding protein 1C [Methyloceanibacter sp.]HZP09040.1 penicillin-binding protein 1C [Methyloceanibacter sp.]
MSTDRKATSRQPGKVGAQRAPGEGVPGPTRTHEPPHPSSLPDAERGRWGRRLVIVAVAFVWIAAAIAGGVSGLFEAFGPAPLGRNLEVSTLVLDRDGKLLRAYLTREGRWRLPAARKDVDPRFVEALLAYEDKRFYHHRGVDPLAMLRAAYQLVTEGHIVSGGSTITMQVARLIEPRQKRSLYAKLHEAVRALQLEWALSKDEILSRYLTLAPYGGNLEGIRAASLAYFGKEPRRLTLGETALLVALPQSPEFRRPDRYPAAAKRARDRVLDRIAGRGLYSAAEIAHAKEEPVPTMRKPMPIVAPHSADEATFASPKKSVIRLTVDGTLQRTLEKLARERAGSLGPDLSVAIVVIDNATGEVLARVASPDYFDLRRAGQVDLTRAVRSPGSALKPFIYGIGFEDGLIHPETLIDDHPIHYGNYAPENFDLTYQGTVTVRRALQLSLNTPAVAVLDEVGPSRLIARLAQAGAPLVLPKDEAPGLALGLGGVGIRLLDLTMLYAGLARQGTVAPLIEQLGQTPQAPKRLIEPVAAWYVGNVLLGTPPPENAAGGRIAFKTGTSYGYRDAWAIGFDGKRTIGVWAGRPDGAPVVGLGGRVTAAPILFDAFARLGASIEPLPRAPKGVLIASSAKLPPPLRRFAPRDSAGEAMTPKVQIVFPPNGANLELSHAAGQSPDPIAIKITGGTPPLNVLLNGMPISAKRTARTLFFEPDGPGFVRLTVTDATGAADSVVVRLQ